MQIMSFDFTIKAIESVNHFLGVHLLTEEKFVYFFNLQKLYLFGNLHSKQIAFGCLTNFGLIYPKVRLFLIKAVSFSFRLFFI